MPRMDFDEDAHRRLVEVRDAMKKNGIRGASLSDAVREMYRSWVQDRDVSGGDRDE